MRTINNFCFCATFLSEKGVEFFNKECPVKNEFFFKYLNDRIEDLGKVLVAVSISSIYTTVLIIKLNSTSDSFTQSKSRRSSFMLAKFVPQLNKIEDNPLIDNSLVQIRI